MVRLSLGFPGLTSVAPGSASPYIWFGVVPGATFKPSRLRRSAMKTVDKAPHLHVYKVCCHALPLTLLEGSQLGSLIDIGLTVPQERQGPGIEVNKRKSKRILIF